MSQDNFHNFSDNELLQQYYTTKNKQVLGALLERYTLLLLGTCIKYLKSTEEAKDAVQQIFYKVINEVDKYKIDYFKSWLYMVTKNHCLMQLRNKHLVIPIEAQNDLTEEPISFNDIWQQEQNIEALHAAIQQLNDEQKKCIQLFYLEKNSYRQIALTTGLSLMQVKSCIQNGKRNLKLMLSKKINKDE